MSNLETFFTFLGNALLEVFSNPIGGCSRLDKYDAIRPYTTQDGHKIVQLFDAFPSLKFLYPFEDERAFAKPALKFACKTMSELYMPQIIVFGYMIFIYFGTLYMAGRPKGFQVRTYWKWYNLAMSIFSFFGALRTLPHLLMQLSLIGKEKTICGDPAYTYGMGASGFWTMLFIFSKVPELMDTVFLVLGKRPIIFLHWYHHVTVLLFCWHSYATTSSSGIFFIAMNYFGKFS
eukprot:g354.t1